MNPTYTSNVVDENRFVDLLRTLYSKNLNFKVKMGLENMILFNQKLGNPANQITQFMSQEPMEKDRLSTKLRRHFRLLDTRRECMFRHIFPVSVKESQSMEK